MLLRVTIIVEPLKYRTAGSIARAHEQVYNYLTLWVLKPKFEILGNECSTELVRLLTKQDISFQVIPPICIEQTLLKESSEDGKIIWFPYSVGWIHVSHSSFEIGCLNRQTWPQIYFAHPDFIQRWLRKPCWIGLTILIVRPSHHWEPNTSSTKNPRYGALGLHMVLMGGTSALLETITDATQYTPRAQKGCVMIRKYLLLQLKTEHGVITSS